MPPRERACESAGVSTHVAGFSLFDHVPRHEREQVTFPRWPTGPETPNPPAKSRDLCDFQSNSAVPLEGAARRRFSCKFRSGRSPRAN